MRVFVFSSLLLIALTGCKPVWNPTFMPSGYTYHHDEYKSAPGPEAKPIGYTYSASDNQKVIDDWQNAARDLLLRAKANDIRPTGPVYLTTDMNPSVFQSTFDSALRDELRAQGYTLSDNPEEGTHLFYSAYDPNDQGPPETVYNYNDEPAHAHKDGDFLPPSQKMELVLALLNDGRIGRKVTSLYEVPLYGFKPAGYVPGFERPLPPPGEAQ